MSRLRIALTAALAPLALGAAFGALAAQGGRWSARLDVFTHFAPLYLAAGVAVLAVTLILARGRLRLLLAVSGGLAVLGALALILPELTRPMSPRSAAPTAGAIKLVQYNAGDAGGDLEAAVRWLAKEKPDILVVEESTAAFREAAQGVGLTHLSCGRTCETAVLSRERPVEVERPRRGRIGLGPAIVLARFEHPAGAFTVAGAHFTWPTQIRTHSENSRRLLELLKDRPRERLILAGDFNSTPWSFARRRDDQALGLERRTRALFSWPARGLPGFPVLPIDHVYAGAGWRTVTVRRGPRIGSDHYPVVAVLVPAR